MNEDLRPPASAEFFAAAIIGDASLREAVLGDLAEEYAQRANDGTRRSANTWYWGQLLRSAIPLSFTAIVKGGLLGWLRLFVAIVVSYAVLAMVVVTTDMWLGQRLALVPAAMPFASLTFAVVAAVFAGYVAAVIGGRSPIAPGIVLGAVCISLNVAILARGGDGSPYWYQIMLGVIVLPSAVAGAMLRARQLVHRGPRAVLNREGK